jgi:hypothetical protein
MLSMGHRGKINNKQKRRGLEEDEGEVRGGTVQWLLGRDGRGASMPGTSRLAGLASG